MGKSGEVGDSSAKLPAIRVHFQTIEYLSPRFKEVFAMMNEPFSAARTAMVNYQLRARGIHDDRLLEAMERIPRHEFVPPEWRDAAYEDGTLPIDAQQRITQPYMVALMTQALHLHGHEHILEIGTGSGYQTAVLCELGAQVTSIECVARLARSAAERLYRLGYDNYTIHVGDGSQGLADMAPFDAILVSAAAPRAPGPIRAQMSVRGGRLVIPAGDPDEQYIEVITRSGDGWYVKRIAAVHFVPLLGRYGFKTDAGSI